MASINFNPFNGNWFSKPPNPLSPPLTTLLKFSQPFSSPSKFASTTLSTNNNNKKPNQNDVVSVSEEDEEEPGPFTKMVQQFFNECENLPDHRNTPQVEKLLNEDPVFEHKQNATEQEKIENEEFMKTLKNNPVIEFLLRAEEIADKMNEIELKKNEKPYHREDRELWKELPHVPGLDGRAMPRKAIKTKLQADVAFWDFARQFFFGLWGFRQRPYPSGKPNDAAQAIGYKNLERRYYDCKFIIIFVIFFVCLYWLVDMCLNLCVVGN